MAKKKQIKNKTISLKEFITWIEGIEEFAGEDWHPSQEQWKRIRDKIDTIDLDVVKVVPQMSSPIVNNNSAMPPMPPQLRSSIPAQASSLDINAPARPITPQPLNAPVQTVGANGALKTPDIDTSDGNYNSMFE